MSWLDKLERRLQPLALPHVVLALVAGQTFFYLAEMFQLVDRSRLVLAWVLVANGEWWRIFSFALVPPAAHWALIAFALYMLHFLGSALEEAWGTLRLNLFLFTGWAFTVAASMLEPTTLASNAFIGGSLFLAFAYLNPNYVFHIFLVLPVRVKWLAALTGVFYAVTFALGGTGTRLFIAASVANFLLFFGSRIVQDLRHGRRRLQQGAVRRAARHEAAAAGPRHTCVICGKNSDTHPDEDFRYRADDRCYCSEHLRVPLPEEAARK